MESDGLLTYVGINEILRLLADAEKNQKKMFLAIQKERASLLEKERQLIQEVKAILLGKTSTKQNVENKVSCENRRKCEHGKKNCAQKMEENSLFIPLNVGGWNGTNGRNKCSSFERASKTEALIKKCRRTCCPFIRLEKLSVEVLNQHKITLCIETEDIKNKRIQNNVTASSTESGNQISAGNPPTVEDVYISPAKRVPIVKLLRLSPLLLDDYGYAYSEKTRDTVRVQGGAQVSHQTFFKSKILKCKNGDLTNNPSEFGNQVFSDETTSPKCNLPCPSPIVTVKSNSETKQNIKYRYSKRCHRLKEDDVDSPVFKKPKLMTSHSYGSNCGLSMPFNSCTMVVTKLSKIHSDGTLNFNLVKTSVNNDLGTEMQRGESNSPKRKEIEKCASVAENKSSDMRYTRSSVSQIIRRKKVSTSKIFDGKENQVNMTIYGLPQPKDVSSKPNLKPTVQTPDGLQRNQVNMTIYGLPQPKDVSSKPNLKPTVQTPDGLQRINNLNISKGVMNTQGSRSYVIPKWSSEKENHENLEFLMTQSFISKDLIFRFMSCAKPYPEMFDLFGKTSKLKAIN